MQKPEIVVEKIGPSGNVFAVMANAVEALNNANQKGASLTLQAHLHEALGKESTTYESVLTIIRRFVNIKVI